MIQSETPALVLASSSASRRAMLEGAGLRFEAIAAAETMLGRKVNPTLYSSAELARKRREDNHFVTRIVTQPKIFLIGGEHDLRP